MIDDPLDSQPLEDIISPGESVLVVVSDATRATGSAQVVNLLVRRLIALGVAPYDLRLIFATGIHRPVTREEKAELLTPFIVQRVRTLAHDASDESKHVRLGETERGTPVELDRALFEHSHVILTGAVGFHYFAGFTGGRKSICPGLASKRTIEATHLQALDFETGGRRAGVGDGATRRQRRPRGVRAHRGRGRALVPHQHGDGRARPRRTRSTPATGAWRTVWPAPSTPTRTSSR